MTVTPFEVGDPVTADALDEQFDPPTGRIRQGTAQTGIASNAQTAITFAATDELDTHDFHNPASNNERVLPTVPGWYRVTGAVSLAGAADYTIIQAVIRKNGTGLAPAFRLAAAFTNQTLVFGTTALVECNGTTDYFDVALQVSKTAGTISTVISVQFASTLEWEFVKCL